MPTRELSGPGAAEVRLMSWDRRPVHSLVLTRSEASWLPWSLCGMEPPFFLLPLPHALHFLGRVVCPVLLFEDMSPVTPFPSNALNRGSPSLGPQVAAGNTRSCSPWNQVLWGRGLLWASATDQAVWVTVWKKQCQGPG